MKKFPSVLIVALVICVQVALAQPQTSNVRPTSKKVGSAASGKSDKGSSKAGAEKASSESSKNKQDNQSSNQEKSVGSSASAPPLNAAGSVAATDAPSKTVASVPNGAPVVPSAPPLTNIYRVGAGDVLDIRLLNYATRESTLFTVMADGLLEYPLAGDPLQVAGLTTDEIDARLTSKIRLYDNPQIVVNVREYASHHVIVTGLVNNPGTKVLRREAMPLYVLLAESQPRPEAGRANIVRADGQSLSVNLSDQKATTMLVLPGDVITLSAPPPSQPQFYFIGGQINAPGQKDFHAGLTLTQAILASGGTSRFAGSKVKVSRQGADGRLVATEYNLKQIETGKIPDPVLQPGDRLEISRGSW